MSQVTNQSEVIEITLAVRSRGNRVFINGTWVRDTVALNNYEGLNRIYSNISTHVFFLISKLEKEVNG